MSYTTNNKFIPSPLPDRCILRTELLSHFNQAAASKIIAVTAPAGFGKTVSTLQWMHSSGRKTIWIALDTFDNTTAIFYRLFCTGILSVQPDNERITAILRDSAFDASPVEYSIRLLAEVNDDENEYALALDDYHAITNPEILRSFPFILRRLPSAFVTLVLSRTKPDGDFAKLIEAGQAAVIGQKDLAFSANEVQAYFTALGRGATEAENAYAHTGGWVIGVNALAHSDAPVPDGYDNQDLESYIKKNIWVEWDEDTRAFMLSSAAIDEMPVALCEKITGRTGADKLLETFWANNAFVSLVEDGVYCYHHLFLEFLRNQPEYTAANHRNPWSVAAKYYFEAKQYLVAQRYAFISGDVDLLLNIWDELLSSMNRAFDEYLNFSNELILSDKIDELCEKCPVFYIACACTAFICGDAQLFKQNMDKLWHALPTILRKYPHFGEMAFALFILDFRTPLSKQIKQLAMLPTIGFVELSGEDMRVASISLQMPFLHRSSRDFFELADSSLYSKLQKAFGKLLRKHFDMSVSCVKTGIALEQNLLNDALSEARANMENMAPWIVKEVRFAMYMHLAAAYLALGKDNDLAETVDDAKRFIDDEAPFLLPNFLAFTTRIKLWDGSEKDAQQWLSNYFVAETHSLETYRLYQYFTTVRAYAVLGDLTKAIKFASCLRQFCKDFHRLQDTAEAGTLLAIFLWINGQKEEAQDMMETVLLEIQPYGFIRLVADEGAAVLPVLKKIAGKAGHADYRGELDPIYVNTVNLAAYTVSKQRAGILSKQKPQTTKLSKQQKMILQLLSQGYQRKDIVIKTGLSLSTVKTHIYLIYEKLGVSNAADAVCRAIELEII